MTKTESDIERDFAAFAKASALGSALKGKVYRTEMRPANAKTEDLIVKFLAGVDEQVQTGIVVFNIYVPDVPYGSNGRMVADKERIAELQAHVRDFIEKEGGSEYWLRSDSTPTTAEAEEIGQHVIVARIRFQRITI